MVRNIEKLQKIDAQIVDLINAGYKEYMHNGLSVKVIDLLEEAEKLCDKHSHKWSQFGWRIGDLLKVVQCLEYIEVRGVSTLEDRILLKREFFETHY